MDELALTSLIIALVALIIALLQLLQQAFVSLHGYPNCQAQIMGPWAGREFEGAQKLTKPRVVWSEFRLETRFKVPYIIIGECNHEDIFCITGTEQSRISTHCPDVHEERWARSNRAGEMVSWIYFLDQLHHLGSAYPEGCSFKFRDDSQPSKRYGPCLTPLDRTWDFMPPDIVKPLAVCTLGSIAVLARRLGMTWIQFEPADSILRAEGNQMTLTSTNIRSVGTVLQFTIVTRESPEMPFGHLYIPNREADMMGFGIVPVWYSGQENVFGNQPPQREIRIGTPDDFIDTMKFLCGDVPSTTRLVRHLKEGGWMPGFSDIIPLASPMMYTKGSTITRIPKPAHYAIGLTVFREGFVVFQHRLQEYIGRMPENDEESRGVKSGAVRVNDWYEELDKKSKDWSSAPWGRESNDLDQEFLESVYDRGMDAENYLRSLNEEGTLRYEDLVRCHIEYAINYKDNASNRLRRNLRRPTYNENTAGDGAWKLEGMHVYFDNIEDTGRILARMEERGYGKSHGLLAVAWFTMIFRAFCWQRCHYMIGGRRVESKYWESRLPVYFT